MNKNIIRNFIKKKFKILSNSLVSIPSKFPLYQLLNFTPFLDFKIKGFKKFSQNCL